MHKNCGPKGALNLLLIGAKERFAIHHSLLVR
jgi:hypothetical protein